MFGHLQIRRWSCLALMLALVACPALGAEGVVYNLVGPNCPNCRAPGSPPCPANVKYFGYYPTRWRPWPGTETAPTPAPPAEQLQPNRVEVPQSDQEAVGKPGATTGDSGTATPPAAGATTDPNGANAPATPSAVPPATVPMLNGLPLPNGAQLPNGAPVPTVTLPNRETTSDKLPAANLPDPAARTSPLPAPGKTPATAPAHTNPSEPEKLNQVWPEPMPSSTASTALAGANGLRIVPRSESAPSYQWPPANMLRSSTIKAGFQAPAETPVPASSSSSGAAAWIEPLPPLSPARGTAPAPIMSNSLRIDMPPIESTASVAGATKGSSQSTVVNPTRKPTEANRSDDHVSMLIIAQKPARPASIPADDWSPKPEDGATETRTPAVANPSSNSKSLNWSAANSPATLAPIYEYPATERPAGNASVNSPGTISSFPPTRAPSDRAGEIRFSPLRDAVLNVRLSAREDSPSESMSAIDPLRIGRTIAEDQQPTMRAVPIQNALRTNRFEASDYVSQDRAAKPMSDASTHQPMPGNSAVGAQRTMDTAVQPASYEQSGPAAASAPNLASIDPLAVARSLGATPGPSVPAPSRPQTAATTIDFPPFNR